MKKSQSTELNIESVSNLGYGVSHIDGKTVFVKYGVTDDRLMCSVIKDAKTYSVAKIDEIITPSERRAENLCPHYKSCGGCVFRHIDYEYEKRIKYDYVKSAFAKYAGIEISPEFTVTYKPDAYRNNVQYPIGFDGRLFPAFYSEKSHRKIKVTNCLTQKNAFDNTVTAVFDILNEYPFSAYDEESGKGYLRHACFRVNREDKISVCLVINGEVTEELKKASEEIANLPSVISVSANINKENTNVIFGCTTVTLAEKEKLCETLCGKKFLISPRSFFQVNTESAEMLFEKAGEFLRLKDGDVLLDLYCGAGTIGIALSKPATKLFGCEIIPDAVNDAVKNAELNGLADFGFVCGDASVGISECIKKYGKIDSLVVDPPRKGLNAETVKEIIASKVASFVYISCNPDTLARDTALFAEAGYAVTKSAVFDLFPRTSHMESVVLLTKTSKYMG